MRLGWITPDEIACEAESGRSFIAQEKSGETPEPTGHLRLSE
tara:strand:+ start:143 stop:268 length:126 start_codon:yes stop_codon:yes gene_type:complete